MNKEYYILYATESAMAEIDYYTIGELGYMYDNHIEAEKNVTAMTTPNFNILYRHNGEIETPLKELTIYVIGYYYYRTGRGVNDCERIPVKDLKEI